MVSLKVPDNHYTMMVDWCGNNFVKRQTIGENNKKDENDEKDENEVKYDVVTVTCSKEAMINWAMQYSDVVEVLGPPSVQNAIEARCKDVRNIGAAAFLSYFLSCKGKGSGIY